MNSRRTFLKGLATTVALPGLESLAAGTRAAVATPNRLAFVYFPNGVNVSEWMVDDGTSPLPSSLEPLKNLRTEFSILRNLDHEKAFANGDGAGDHARANATFLTGCQARKTAGADIRAGVSVDQIAAREIGGLTRLQSLELSTDPSRNSGHCDSGYSCAYQFNLSWLNETTPAPAERDPRIVFERLFGSGNPGEDRRRRTYRKSILDFVRDDAKSLQRRLGATDRAKLDEYLTAVRHLEQRIERSESRPVAAPDAEPPDGIPESYREHIRIQFELMALAFQTDTTRIATFMLAHDGSNRSFPEIGVDRGHHQISHHQGKEDNLRDIAKIDRFYVEQFAAFLERLRNTREAEGSLLDHSMILYGGGIHDGNRHNHNDLPILLAGRGNGQLQPGRVVKAEEGTPMTNLHLALLDRMGVEAERVGDSNGTFEQI